MSKHLSVDVRVPIETDNPSIQRDEEKCIRCGQCKNICRDYIDVLGTYDLEATGNRAICIYCGQCANVCPTGSITEKYEYAYVKKAIKDPGKVVIINTSPSVRIALGEEFGLEDGSFVQGKMVSLLRALGADYVLDTNFAADMTIVEEASELIERITKEVMPLPQFTSCCPAWVKFAEVYYPELLPNISTAKSPIGMQGPTAKTYFAKKMGIDSSKIVNVALTPCTAKKYEIRREEMNAASKYLDIPRMRDMDYVITTRELALWAKEEGVDFQDLAETGYDFLMGEGSGAGVIFGNTGGVMEAAVRTAYEYLTGGKAPAALYELQPVRGMEGVRETSLQIGSLTMNLAVVYGTGNIRGILEKIKSGEKQYHFIEVMTCPGGCIGGGGQPKDKDLKGDALRKKRIEGLYRRDGEMQQRLSHENTELKQLYGEFYGKPLSPLAEQLLHTVYQDRSHELSVSHNLDSGQPSLKETVIKQESPAELKQRKFICQVCGYLYEGEEAPVHCPICHAPSDRFTPQAHELEWAAEHMVGAAQGAGTGIMADLRANFSGECAEAGMYLAMARVAYREGYPEIGKYFEKAAFEEAEHAAKFAELLGETITDSTKRNLETRVDAENGAALGKYELAKRAKEASQDAIHDRIHEMAKDEARHGKAFEGLLKRYFG